MNLSVSRAILAGLCALSLSACIDSATPILTDAQPVMGPRLNLQLYTLSKGFADEPEKVSYVWNGKLYAHAGGGMKDIGAISLHPFESGDFIVQAVPARAGRTIEYALLHQIASGAYLVIAIDEADADDATRAANCTHPGGTACRVTTREQLFAMARATAAHHKDQGGLVLRLPDAPTKRRP
ncbi:MAG TPA: hypothetical protein VGF02_04790 [Pseudolabrys sp.]